MKREKTQTRSNAFESRLNAFAILSYSPFHEEGHKYELQHCIAPRAAVIMLTVAAARLQDLYGGVSRTSLHIQQARVGVGFAVRAAHRVELSRAHLGARANGHALYYRTLPRGLALELGARLLARTGQGHAFLDAVVVKAAGMAGRAVARGAALLHGLAGRHWVEHRTLGLVYRMGTDG